MQVTLYVRAPKKPEKRVVVENDVVIGRGKNCNLQVLSNDVSRQHCRLVIGDSGVAIRDLGSGNGTQLNGQRTEPNVDSPLVSGDIVRIGPLVIKVDFATPVSPVDMTPTEATSPSEIDVSESLPDVHPADSDAESVDAEPAIEPVRAEEQMLEPLDERSDELTADDGELIADEFAEAELEAAETVNEEEPSATGQQPGKMKSLFGMFGKKKNKTEPDAPETQSVESDAAEELEVAGHEPLLADDDADVDQETVVFDQGNAFTPEEDELEMLADEESVADDDDYLDEDDEEDALDPGFADFLNQVDQPPS